MCFEKPLFWWLFETHVASACLGGGYIRAPPYADGGRTGFMDFR